MAAEQQGTDRQSQSLQSRRILLIPSELADACSCWLLQLSAAVAPAGDAAAAPQWGVSTTTTRRAAAA